MFQTTNQTMNHMDFIPETSHDREKHVVVLHIREGRWKHGGDVHTAPAMCAVRVSCEWSKE